MESWKMCTLHLQQVDSTKIDLVLCCGDFQAVRNEKDLDSLNVPEKYRSMNSFWKYYSGEKLVPVPTIFIVVKFGNVRIGGLSGIYKRKHYLSGHYERQPYNEDEKQSIYHICEFGVHKLMQLEEPVDVFLSHDWPCGITDHGDVNALLCQKPSFAKEIQEITLGSKPAAEFLKKMRPSYWFSAHLHCKFAALVQHGEGGPITNFIALDECLPQQKFLQIVDIESEPGPYEIQYDEEWLSVRRKFNSVFPLTIKRANVGDVQLDMTECRLWVRDKLQTRGAKPFEFVQTVPRYDPLQSHANGSFSGYFRNPQTEAFLWLL